MLDTTDLPNNIVRDYKTVSEYARDAATVIDKTLRVRSFHKHVPHRHKIEGALTMDRSQWGMFDSLPRSLRDVVNDDPGNVIENLNAALAMWNDMTTQAENAMDRIIGYEKVVEKNGLDLPMWLTQEKTEELDTILKLKAEREAEAARLAAERKQQEADAAAARKAAADREYRVGGRYSYYTANDRTDLTKVELVDTRGMPPHLARELLAKAQPLKFEKYNIWVAPGKTKLTEKRADELDNAPPAKIHPMHMKRGRNF